MCEVKGGQRTPRNICCADTPVLPTILNVLASWARAGEEHNSAERTAEINIELDIVCLRNTVVAIRETGRNTAERV